jgi:hypothetical protein
MNIDGEGAIDVDVTGFSNEADPAAESGDPVRTRSSVPAHA